MGTNNSEYRDVRVSINEDTLSLYFKSAFGEVSLALNLENLAARLSRIISDLLDRIERHDPNVLTEIAQNSGVSAAEVRKSLERLTLYKKRRPTQTATDEFIGGKDLHLQAILEQLIDNLPEGVELMLLHLAMAAIARTVPDVQKSHGSKLLAREDELLDLITPHFKKSINQLWERN